MSSKLIRREFAEQYLENVIVSFVLTLLGVRLFLQLAGYPQLGGAGLHIAHAIWGGLFLLAAALLALLFRNQSVLVVSSVLTGTGWALFVDELGKFITADNDYFFRPAAPLIYLTFLALWFVAVRFPWRSDLYSQIYQVLDRFDEVIEARVDPDDLQLIKVRLTELSQDRPDSITDELARALLHFVERETISTREHQPSALALGVRRGRRLLDRYLLSAQAMRAGFPLGLVLYGGALLLNLGAHFLALLRPDLATVVLAGLDVDPLSSSANILLFLLMNVVRIVVVLLLWLAALRLRRGRGSGWRTAHSALVLSVVAADVLSFYFSQFSAAIVAVADVLLLAAVNHVQSLSRRQALEATSGEAGG